MCVTINLCFVLETASGIPFNSAAMKKKTLIKVNINCQLCQKDVMKAVTKLKGIDQVLVEAEKGTVTVVGEVDPVMVANRVSRTTGKTAEIMSVGPLKPPEPNTPKPKSPDLNYHLPSACDDGQLVAISFSPNDGKFCVIL